MLEVRHLSVSAGKFLLDNVSITVPTGGCHAIVGATITLAGTMAMRTETLPIAIFMQLSTANIEGTVALILILTALGFATLFAVRIVTGWRHNA